MGCAGGVDFIHRMAWYRPTPRAYFFTHRVRGRRPRVWRERRYVDARIRHYVNIARVGLVRAFRDGWVEDGPFASGGHHQFISYREEGFPQFLAHLLNITMGRLK